MFTIQTAPLNAFFVSFIKIYIWLLDFRVLFMIPCLFNSAVPTFLLHFSDPACASTGIFFVNMTDVLPRNFSEKFRRKITWQNLISCTYLVKLQFVGLQHCQQKGSTIVILLELLRNLNFVRKKDWSSFEIFLNNYFTKNLLYMLLIS